MANSENGYVANNATLTASQRVPGTTLNLRVRKDSPGLLLLEVASAFDKLVEDIDNYRGVLDDWGYAERAIRGGTLLSNHASGTAIDLNAPKHPLGRTGTFTKTQVIQIQRILAACGGAVRWGGNYIGRKDEMHFEITPGASIARCTAALATLRKFMANLNAGTPTKNTPNGTSNPAGLTVAKVIQLQRVLNAWYPTVSKLTVDGDYGSATTAMVKYAQGKLKLTVDGIAGPITLSKLGIK